MDDSACISMTMVERSGWIMVLVEELIDGVNAACSKSNNQWNMIFVDGGEYFHENSFIIG